MKKSEIQKNAEKLMKDKGVDTVHATSDGQLFFEENAAQLHSNTNAKGNKLSVYTFCVNDAVSEGPAKPKNKAKAKAEDTVFEEEETPLQIAAREARELKAKIETIEDVAELNKLEAEENERESPRKSILNAIGARNAELVKDGGEKNDDKRKDDDK